MKARKIAAQVRRFVWLAAAASTAIGVLLVRARPSFPLREYWPWLLFCGALVLLYLVVDWFSRTFGSRGVLRRLLRRGSRNNGMATTWAILRSGSKFSLRRKAKTLRPSLAKMNPIRRRLVSATELGVRLVRVGMVTMWSAIEDVTLIVGGPRSGKSGLLASAIVTAPGAVITTTTRFDLMELTGPVREKKGPVYLFNPSGVDGLPSTITFDPLHGCEDPELAAARAQDLLRASAAPGTGGEREFWTFQAGRVLECLMHAAALDEASMHDVLTWVADPDTAAADVERALLGSPEPAYQADALQFFKLNDRTRSSICATIMPALGWLTNKTAVAAATNSPTANGGTGPFDVAKLLADRGTVYMVQDPEQIQTAPLVTALTAHIAREARRMAGGRRLDPPLQLALDEAPTICPIPLDEWTNDMSGRNITMLIVAQSLAQLRKRWGSDGAQIIQGNAASLVVFGGIGAHDDLQALSLLAGQKDEEVPTYDADGEITGYHVRREPVLPADKFRAMPDHHAAVFRRGMQVAVGKAKPAWKRADVRWALFSRWLAERAAVREAKRAAKADSRHLQLDVPFDPADRVPLASTAAELPAPRDTRDSSAGQANAQLPHGFQRSEDDR